MAYTIRFNNNELTFMPIFFYCTSEVQLNNSLHERYCISRRVIAAATRYSMIDMHIGRV